MTTSILALAESMTHRPRMYTANGSFPEVIAFLRGYVAGAGRVNAAEPLLLEWEGFETWLGDRIGTEPTEALEAILATNEGDPCEAFARYLQEYRREQEGAT